MVLVKIMGQTSPYGLPASQISKLNWKKLEGGTQPGTAPSQEICQCDKIENKIETLYFNMDIHVIISLECFQTCVLGLCIEFDGLKRLILFSKLSIFAKFGINI